MSPEQLEFLLTQYLDGTLPPAEAGALEQVLATDPVARALRDEHEKLTVLLRSQPLPEIAWGELSRDLCAVVTGTVDDAQRGDDQKLNAILKGIGPVPEVHWSELSKRISAAVDAEVAGVNVEDQKLEALLRSTPLPAVHWDRLAGHLSNAVAAEGRAANEVSRPAVAGRIGWVRTASRLAMAACVIVAAGLGIRFYSHTGPGTAFVNQTGPGTESSKMTIVSLVETPKIEAAEKPAVAEISIGRSNAYADNSDLDLYRRGVASRSPVVIALPVAAEEDADPLMWFE